MTMTIKISRGLRRPLAVHMMGGDFGPDAPCAVRIVLDRRSAIRWGERQVPRLVPIETRLATNAETAGYYARYGHRRIECAT